VAEVYPSADGQSSNFQIESKGVFGGAERQVKILIALPKAVEAIQVTHACADPNSTVQGTTISISADISSTYPISAVTATIRNSVGNVATITDFSCVGCTESGNKSGIFTAVWDTGGRPAQDYFVDIEAEDTLIVPNHIKCENISPNGMCGVPTCHPI
jgi:hypothetical protein